MPFVDDRSFFETADSSSTVLLIIIRAESYCLHHRHVHLFIRVRSKYTDWLFHECVGWCHWYWLFIPSNQSIWDQDCPWIRFVYQVVSIVRNRRKSMLKWDFSCHCNIDIMNNNSVDHSKENIIQWERKWKNACNVWQLFRMICLVRVLLSHFRSAVPSWFNESKAWEESSSIQSKFEWFTKTIGMTHDTNSHSFFDENFND
jgi:hypothetical protein